MIADESALVNALFELEEETYMVDNSSLKSRSNGIRYRLSPSLTDTDQKPGRQSIAGFGELVEGVSFPDGWLMIGGFGKRRFLPTHLQGVRVLVRTRGGRMDRDSEVRAAGNCIPEGLSSASSVRLGSDSSVSACMGASKPSQACSGIHQVAFRSPASQGRDQSEARAGSDEAPRPSTQRRTGEELLEVVSREIPDQASLAAGILSLLRALQPEGVQIDACNDEGDTPLMIAALRGYLDYCVILIISGANTALRSQHGLAIPDLSTWGPAKALMRALCGHDFNAREFEVGMNKLQPQVRMMAEELLQSAPSIVAACNSGGPFHELEGCCTEWPRSRSPC